MYLNFKNSHKGITEHYHINRTKKKRIFVYLLTTKTVNDNNIDRLNT